MGYQRDHAIVVTSERGTELRRAHRAAASIFPWVSPISPIAMNGSQSFFVPPDGASDGHGPSAEGDARREMFVGWLNQQCLSDGSTHLKWVEVRISDDEGRLRIERSHARPGRPDPDMRKVAIETGDGIFNLSLPARKALAKRKGHVAYWFDRDPAGRWVASTEDTAGVMFTRAYDAPNPPSPMTPEWHVRHSLEALSDVPRHDPDLLAVLLEFGEGARGKGAACIRLIDVPADVEYLITQAEGCSEIIEERHRTWP